MAAKEIDPFDVEALEKSLNDSATRVSALWISFLVFGLYLVIAAGTVSKLQLLLQDPIKLPVLNIDLPLVGFFALAPVLFVIFHAYLVIQVLLLGRTAAAYNEAMEASIRTASDNARLRQRLANTLFAQLFAGSPRERTGWLGTLLTAMAWFSLAVAPTFVLLVFQFTFLPFHNGYVTWEHRLLILIELVVVFLVWPLALDPRRELDWKGLYRRWYSWAAGGLFVTGSVWLLSFPGESHIGLFSEDRDGPRQCERFPAFLASIDRLDLPAVDVVDDEKFAKIEKARADRKLAPDGGEPIRSFRDRNLSCSDFSHGDLRRVDFTRAYAIGADWSYADLQGATLDYITGRGISLARTRLQRASMIGAHLEGATFFHADLSGANLADADLRRTEIRFAKLRGSNMPRATLDESRILNADFRGARLAQAQLRCASIRRTDFRGVNFFLAGLQGATFTDATTFDAANLRSTQLQAARFQEVSFKGARLSAASIWRTETDSCVDALVSSPDFTPSIEHPSLQATIESTNDDVRRFFADCSPSDFDVTAILSRDASASNATWQACAADSDKLSVEELDEIAIATVSRLICGYEETDASSIENILALWTERHLEGVSSTDHDARLARGFRTKLARRLLSEPDCAGLALLGKSKLQALRKWSLVPPSFREAHPAP